MGIYDRDYYREPRRPEGLSFRTPRTIIGWLIAVNVAVWIADFFTPEIVVRGHIVGHWLSDQMAVHADTIMRPWLWWQFLTAGFAHSPLHFQHILFNMLVLFFLGRDVEGVYGSKEFLRLYLAMVVFASVAWSVLQTLWPTDGMGAFGASGAIAGVVVLYAFNFPHRTLLLFFVIPIPAWLLGVLVVFYDMWGAYLQNDNVAYSMHLAGAAFALLYHQLGWNLTRLTSGFPGAMFRRRPRLRVHAPDDEPEFELSVDVDRILEKIYREGEASLSAQERKVLEAASREYQRRTKGGVGRGTGGGGRV